MQSNIRSAFVRVHSNNAISWSKAVHINEPFVENKAVNSDTAVNRRGWTKPITHFRSNRLARCRLADLQDQKWARGCYYLNLHKPTKWNCRLCSSTWAGQSDDQASTWLERHIETKAETKAKKKTKQGKYYACTRARESFNFSHITQSPSLELIDEWPLWVLEG